MATAAAFTSLQAPAPEDTMEMSSPANRAYDDDIDIDFDDGAGGVNLTDDERMMEDGEQTRPPTATDDMMEDDAQPPAQLHVQESEMQDDFDPTAYEQANDEDDELIDYGDEEYVDFTDFQEQPIVEAAPPAPEIEVTDEQPVEEDGEQVDEEIVREPEMPAADHGPELVQEVVAEQPAQPDESGVVHAEAASVHETHDDAPAVLDPIVSPAQNVATVEAPAAFDQEIVEEVAHDITEDETLVAANADDDAEPVAGRPPPAPLNTAVSFSVDAPGTPTDTGLHPMTLTYDTRIWPLFKSRKQPEGILKDDNLASVSLVDLLAHCKSGLKAKLGDVSEDQEFSLFFGGLGLTVTEKSGSAANTSLDEVLELYKQLYINDGMQETEIPTLSLTLSAHLKFSSLFAFLKQGADAGQGMSAYPQFSAQEAHEDGATGAETTPDQHPTLGGDNTGEEYYDQEQQNEYLDGDEYAGGEVDYQEYDHSYEDVEGNNDQTEGYDQTEENADDQVDFTAYEGYAVEEAAAESADAARPEPQEDSQDQPTQAADAAAQDAAARSEQPTTADAAVEANAEGQDGDANVESVASSTTLRGSNTNDAVEHGDNEDDLTSLTGLEGDEAEPENDSAIYKATSGEQDGLHVDADIQHATDDPSLDNARPDQDEVAEPTPANDAEYQQAATGQDETDDQDQLYRDDDAYDLTGKGLEFADQTLSHTDGTLNGQQSHHESFLNGDEHGLEHQATAAEATVEAGKDQDGLDDFDEEPPPIPDDDSIDFDDDTTEQHEARKASQANISVSGNGSPSGKRSFDETEHVDGIDERELKKARSS